MARTIHEIALDTMGVVGVGVDVALLVKVDNGAASMIRTKCSLRTPVLRLVVTPRTSRLNHLETPKSCLHFANRA